MPLDGGTPLDTGVLRRGRQQGLIVDYAAAGVGGRLDFLYGRRPAGCEVWRQRVSPTTRDAMGAPELMTAGGEYAFFPAVTRGRMCFVGTHADVNLWSVAVDVATGKPHGPLRRLTRGAGIVSHLTVSRTAGRWRISP